MTKPNTMTIDVALNTESLNVVTDLNDSMKEVSKSATVTSNTLKALTEVLKVDPEKLKEALIMGALKDAAEGNEVTYEGNIWKDILELVERLMKERDEARNSCRLVEKKAKNLSRTNCEKYEKIKKAKMALNWDVVVPTFLGRGWCSKQDANDALLQVCESYNKIIADTYSVLSN